MQIVLIQGDDAMDDITKLRTGAIYIRVSTSMQDELSPDSQKKLLLDYAKKNNIIVDEQYIFEEIGVSGKKADKRPQFQKMIGIAKSKEHKFDVILVWKYSRFARNQEESIVYKSLLKKNNIDVISISEPLIDGPFGSLIERIIEWMDEYYSIRLSGEVVRGMTEKAMRGGNQAKAVYGYDIERGHTPQINQKESEIVKMIFDMYVNRSKSTFFIARHINNLGITTKAGKPFAKRTIEYMLTNPFYSGIIRWNLRDKDSKKKIRDKSEWIVKKGEHEAIISEELFEASKKRFESEHNNIKKVRPSQTYTHYLSGLMYCSSCGSTLVRSKGNNTNGKVYANFQCNYYNKGQCKTSHAISQLKAEKAIKDSLESFLNDDNCSFKKKVNESVATDTTFLESQLEKIKIKEERIKLAYMNEIDTLEEYKANKELLQKEKGNILKELNKINSDNAEITKEDIREMKNRVEIALSMIESEKFTIEEKSQYLKSIIEKIIFNKHHERFEVYYFLS